MLQDHFQKVSGEESPPWCPVALWGRVAAAALRAGCWLPQGPSAPASAPSLLLSPATLAVAVRPRVWGLSLLETTSATHLARCVVPMQLSGPWLSQLPPRPPIPWRLWAPGLISVPLRESGQAVRPPAPGGGCSGLVPTSPENPYAYFVEAAE